MKTFFVTLAAFSIALLIGCQENMINEPAGTLNKKGDNSVNTSYSKLIYEVTDPIYGMSSVTGKVTFVFQLINRAMSPLGLNEVSVQIAIDALLDNNLGMLHLEWRANAKTSDIVYVGKEGIKLIYKHYQISNRKDIQLVVEYIVTTDGVGISAVRLSPIDK